MGIINIKGKTFEKYIDNEEINLIIKSLSQKINNDYSGKEICFIVVLNGAFIFATDLFKQIEGLPTISFIKLSSYDGLSSTGKVKELIGLNTDIKGKNVIIVDDIIDTGNTMELIVEMLKEKKPSSLEVCTLMFKPQSFKKDFNIKYFGREISDEFIIGYGLDFDEYGRNLKDIYQIKNDI
ncbi:MAG: hypoxanthine phosphoribosyltransferase [Bacteroidales bacterium]|nr:hypoxanthine phosphoribosyltransferase [Bacteroidales bacterium]MDD4684657.1 hypoxanthine phosphoribosyltransferase [Bacteroidales bacterium]